VARGKLEIAATDRTRRANMERKASVVIVERLPLCGEALALLLEELGADVVGRAKTFAAGLKYLQTQMPNFFVMGWDGG
jgi:hypothetical protein